MKCIALLSISLMLSSVLSNIAPTTVSAHPKADRRVRVIIVEDRTTASGCKRWVHSPRYSYACPPGTIIGVREGWLEDAQRSGAQDYAVLTNNPTWDGNLRVVLIQRLIDRLHPTPQAAPIPLACTPHNTTTIGQSAVLQGIRIYEELSYSLQSTCAITNIVERTRADIDGQVGWLWSKNTDSQTLDRTQAISNLWTAWHSLPNSGKGQRRITRLWHYSTDSYFHFLDTYF